MQLLSYHGCRIMVLFKAVCLLLLLFLEFGAWKEEKVHILQECAAMGKTNKKGEVKSYLTQWNYSGVSSICRTTAQVGCYFRIVY